MMEFNFVAIILGGLLYMAFGAFYYSPILFGKKWAVLNNVDLKEAGAKPFVSAIAVAFLNSILMATLVELTSTETVSGAVVLGLIVSAILSFSYFKNMMFGMMKKSVFLIAIGDHVIILTILSILHTMF
ncbi:DUF1761 domain-containing protein [Bacillus kexueae]|uniref:DUF1761 domain-containing protein n=1 Tax=Aeribacillus kexueae TaxID=2078952 RepID=UPI001FAFCE67|nr:DUF1761 domain-containing protein [Bacillus kexueae]